MALYATNRFPGDGSTTSYEFNFVGKYIARTHVKVYQEDDATKVRTPVPINDSNFLNDTTLRSLPVTPVGSTLVIYRDTPKPPLVDFVNGSRFTEYSMDLVARQGLFVAMEALDALEPLGGLPAQVAGVYKAWEESLAAAATATAAAATATEARNKVVPLAKAVEAQAADVLSAWAEIMPAKVETLAAAAAAVADRIRAETAAAWTDIRASQAEAAANSVEASSTSAAASAATADALASSLVGGTIGFDSTAYDWGYISDAMTYFNQDWGDLP